MATTLLEALKKSMTAPAAPTPASAIDQTSLIAGLAAAKSGKAAPSGTSAPRASSIGEEQQQAANQVSLQQQVQQGQVQAQGMQQAAEQEDLQSKLEGRALDERSLEVRDQFTRQSEAIIRDFARNSQNLDLNRKKARAEQLGFNLRLGNQKYLDDLEDNGRRARLDDAVRFREEVQRSVFTDEQDLFQNDLQFRALMRADERTFADQMAAMDIDYALQIAETDAKAANQKMMWDGVGSIVQGGILAAGQYKPSAGPKAGPADGTGSITASKGPASGGGVLPLPSEYDN